jgi:chromate transporter
VVFFGLLLALPVLAAATGSRDLAVFDGFYRSGSLVFNGGHVVLPLLRWRSCPGLAHPTTSFSPVTGSAASEALGVYDTWDVLSRCGVGVTVAHAPQVAQS